MAVGPWSYGLRTNHIMWMDISGFWFWCLWSCSMMGKYSSSKNQACCMNAWQALKLNSITTYDKLPFWVCAKSTWSLRFATGCSTVVVSRSPPILGPPVFQFLKDQKCPVLGIESHHLATWCLFVYHPNLYTSYHWWHSKFVPLTKSKYFPGR